MKIHRISYITLSELTMGLPFVREGLEDMYNGTLTWGDACFTMTELDVCKEHLESWLLFVDDPIERVEIKNAISKATHALDSGAEYLDFEN